VLLYGKSKEERRAIVARHHDIVMLLGDSLTDFDGAFDHASPAQQKLLERKFSARWGRSWIMFPNAAYGAWSDAPLRAWNGQ
jgi:predicted secreted acid phosphatase